jgi:hypothetical protein
MNTERTEETPHVTVNVAVTDENEGQGANAGNRIEKRSAAAAPPAHGDASARHSPGQSDKSPASAVSKTKIDAQSRLPALEDDVDVGVQKEQIVIRDGKADLRFVGTLLGSAAPATAAEGRWEELRVYKTEGGKHVFSKVKRNVLIKEADVHTAEVYDPNPSSMPSQLIKSAREMTRSRPLTWADGAVAFFGYDPLAKELYRKLNVRFEEEVR